MSGGRTDYPGPEVSTLPGSLPMSMCVTRWPDGLWSLGWSDMTTAQVRQFALDLLGYTLAAEPGCGELELLRRRAGGQHELVSRAHALGYSLRVSDMEQAGEAAGAAAAEHLMVLERGFLPDEDQAAVARVLALLARQALQEAPRD